MAKSDILDFALPAAMLELGELLSAKASFRRSSLSQPGNQQTHAEQVDSLVDALISKATKDTAFCRMIGLRRSPAGRIRLKAVAILAWQTLRLSSETMDLGDLAAGTADPKLPPAEALLRARHEIGVMLAEDTLIGVADTSERNEGPIRKARLPGRTTEFLAGGRASMGFLTVGKLVGLPTPQDEQPSKNDPKPLPIPTASDLQTRIAEKVIGLDGPVRSLSSLLVMHMARAQMLRNGNDPGTSNQAVLLAGGSGCGKTFLMSEAARVTGCPFSSLSATAMSSEAFVGGKLDDLFRAILVKTKGDLQVARYGIAFTDEWDKKASRFGRDITTTCIQQEILVPMQGAEFAIYGKRSNERQIIFNSVGTFFAFAGAFTGLAELIRKKTTQTCIGFSAGTKTRRQEYVLDAIRDYGYVREWVNRLTSVMFLPDPSLPSLEKAAANGVLESFNALVGELGIVLFPHGGAISRMAEYALESRTFYRGVKSVWWSIAEQAVASGEKGTVLVGRADVDAATVRVASGSVGAGDQLTARIGGAGRPTDEARGELTEANSEMGFAGV